MFRARFEGTEHLAGIDTYRSSDITLLNWDVRNHVSSDVHPLRPCSQITCGDDCLAIKGVSVFIFSG